MKIPETPTDERKRLETLRTLKILDTAPEERFDRLTRIAKRVFEVPISLVSLVDENRQWFKSKQGLDADETSRDISFCGHTILGHDVFMIEDAQEDERFSDNPLVTDNPNIRFYAGCPIRVANGSKLGTLCLIDRKPRTLDEYELLLLRDLAEMAEQEIAAVQLATLDELTLISNRRGFLILAEHAISLCIRKNLPATLLLFDLNDFKPINDTFGHAEGDRALKSFADIMRLELRDSDVFARIGGDEFAALLADANDNKVQDALTRFRIAIDSYNRESQRGYDIKYSVGYVEFDRDNVTTIEELLDLADKLMYEQKKSSTR